MTAVLVWLAENWLELFGFVTGGACVLLAAVRSVWTFPVGLASNAVYILVFLNSALYADSGLQIVYVVLGITGWVGWLRHRADDRRAATRHTPLRAIPLLVLAFAAATAILALLLTVGTDSTTQWADAGTTSSSLVAQVMLNWRWIENWFVWAATDVVYVGLYAYKGLWITAALYVLFIAMCAWGWWTWRRAPHVTAGTGAHDARSGLAAEEPHPGGVPV